VLVPELAAEVVPENKVGGFPPLYVDHITGAFKLCVCDGICEVESVVAPDVPTEPDTACDANAVVNATEPPVVTEPLTTRNALLSCVVDFVHPVGADVCTNSMTVPDGNTSIVPLVAGKVSVVVPATAGAEIVAAPLVSPEITTDAIYIP
jgi:hypothetical protein